VPPNLTPDSVDFFRRMIEICDAPIPYVEDHGLPVAGVQKTTSRWLVFCLAKHFGVSAVLGVIVPSGWSGDAGTCASPDRVVAFDGGLL
jgi:hypothetical protein